MEIKSDYTPPGEGKWTFTGYHMTACVVAFFAVIMFANFTMAWFASSSWTGLVVKSSYVAGQKFNKKQETARAQKARGWKTTLSYDNETVGFLIFDKDNNPVSPDNITMKFFRPVSQDKDTVLVLNDQGEGRFISPLKLSTGIWQFSLLAKGEYSYRLEGRMYVSEDGHGQIQ